MATRHTTTAADKARELRRILTSAPPARGDSPPDLLGWWLRLADGDAWVCAKCAERICARGCGTALAYGQPLYADDDAPRGICIAHAVTCGSRAVPDTSASGRLAAWAASHMA